MADSRIKKARTGSEMKINKYSDTIRACRYCPMCRHVCTSGNLSFHESDYPRGRGLLLDKIYKETLHYSPDVVESLYNCFLCGCCWANCEGGFLMQRLVEASRKDIVSLGCQPGIADEIRELIVTGKNPYAGLMGAGATGSKPGSTVFEPDNGRVDKKADILYFMGDNIKFNFHDIAGKTIGILDWLGADYTLLSGEPTEGKILRLLGFEKDAAEKAGVLVKRIKNLGIGSIVISDPLSYDAFKNDFADYGIKLDTPIEHISRVFAEFLEGYRDRGNPERDENSRCGSGHLELNRIDKKTTIADSEFLGRFNSVYEEPRNLIQAITENFVEMRNNRSRALATGEAAFIFNSDHFRMGQQLGKKICSEAGFSGAELLITLSATAKNNLAGSCKKNGIQVMEISEFLWNAINNKK